MIKWEGAVRSRGSKQKREEGKLLIREATNLHADYVNVHKSAQWKAQEDWKDVAACFSWHAISLHFDTQPFYFDGRSI